jgi:hypothetical protein
MFAILHVLAMFIAEFDQRGRDPGMGEQDHHAAGKPADQLAAVLVAERNHGPRAFSSPTRAILR